MSSETDHPRQRTVAELLAEHGDAAATGRRRRRREAGGAESAPQALVDGPAPVIGATPAVPTNGATAGPSATEATASLPANEAAAGPPANGATAGPPANGNGHGATPTGPSAWPPPDLTSGPDRSILREPVPQDTGQAYAPPPHQPREYGPPRAYAPAPVPERARPVPPARENPTDHIPRYRQDRTGGLDPGLTGPIEQRPRPVPGKAPAAEEPVPAAESADDSGPATMIGAAPGGAEAWHRSRTAQRPDGTAQRPDGTAQRPDGTAQRPDGTAQRPDGTAQRPDRPAHHAAGGPATQAASPVEFDDRPAGLGDRSLPGDHDDPAAGAPQRRLGRSSRSSGEASPGQAWAAVVAQWIVGAIGGAALWVGFRFLWRELPVVALAAAVLVTVGLVLVVRALLRNNDMRTTVFAVLVGLLLTVSPAILVLLGR